MKNQRIKRRVSGVLLLDKPYGLSSNLALQKVKRLFHAEKAGHTGSLDPLATGMLPICFGEATKFSQFLLNLNKTYHVVAKLGVATNTGDLEGEVISESAVPDYDCQYLNKVLDDFRGAIEQVPSMFSALKYQGKSLYELARQGKVVDRPARSIYIDNLDLLSYQDNLLSLSVSCSKGTYIRSLVEDIGKNLGCGAHVTSLHRTAVGDFGESQMQRLCALEAAYDADNIAALDQHLLPVEVTLSHLPRVVLDGMQARDIMQGKRVYLDGSDQAEGIVVLMSEALVLLGIGEYLSGAELKPKRLVNL